MTEEYTYPDDLEEPDTELEKFPEPPPLPPALEEALGPIDAPPPLPPQEPAPYFQAPPAYGEPAPDPFAEQEAPAYMPPPAYTPPPASVPSAADMTGTSAKGNNKTLIIVLVVFAVLVLCCCCGIVGVVALFWEDIAYELGLSLLSLFQALPY